MIYKSFPKINICLKVLEFLPNGYCSLASRFVLVENDLYDEMEIRADSNFKLRGEFGCAMNENSIFKAKFALQNFLLNNNQAKKARFLDEFSIEVIKKIPICAGLGGGSGNAGIYLLAMNEMLELHLDKKILMQIASNIGADVSFFVSGFKSANVFGYGQIVEEFSENIPTIEIILNDILCDTKMVYDEFKKNPNINAESKKILELDSTALLQKYDMYFLNDLCKSAFKIYPKLAQKCASNYFFSGSGSSFFKLAKE